MSFKGSRLRTAALALAAAGVMAPAAYAKRDYQAWPIADFVNNPEYMDRLSGVTFTWGDNITGQPVASTSVERATSGIGKTDKEACEWALLSVLLQMRNHALERGAKSVQGLKSTTAGAPYSSDTEYLCMTGHTNSRVYMEGKIVMEAPVAGAVATRPAAATAKTPPASGLDESWYAPAPEFTDVPLDSKSGAEDDSASSPASANAQDEGATYDWKTPSPGAGDTDPLDGSVWDTPWSGGADGTGQTGQ